MHALIIPLLAATLLLAGCASQPERPDWIDTTPQSYPAERWLTGQGTGATATEAERHARAALARNIEVRVHDTSEDVVRYERTGDHPAEVTRAVARHTTTHTDLLLEGVRIAERWRSPDDCDHYALAVLDRHAASDRLRRAIDELDQTVRAAIGRAKAAETPLRQLQAAEAALQAQRERERLEIRLLVVDPSRLGAPSRLSSSELGADYATLLARLTVAPGGSDETLQMAAAALAQAGFGIDPNADYRLLTRLEGHPFQQEGWHWVRGELTITLLYAGQPAGEQRWPLKAAARDAGTAEARFRHEAAELLKRELRDVILGFGRND